MDLRYLHSSMRVKAVFRKSKGLRIPIAQFNKAAGQRSFRKTKKTRREELSLSSGFKFKA